MSSIKSRVIELYKALLFLGRDYPLGYNYFRSKCHAAFMKNRGENNPEILEQKIKHGEYIVKELEALYMLKKYRTLKRRYYDKGENELEYQSRLKNIESERKY